ncbi:MAG: hypothetical protein JJ975_13910 [Bacteroidia bacterium]|nr:hypothetical protein [Bacteroidia bacterium]
MTLTTQVGGVIYLLHAFLFVRFGKQGKPKKLKRRISFVVWYLLICLLVVPLFARLGGRRALPVWGMGIRPQNVITVLSNRHYVSTAMYHLVTDVAKTYGSSKTEGSTRKLCYLDANFPFIEGFPLLPHLSHDDGNKLDLAFHYYNTNNIHRNTNQSPGLFGYGVYVPPEQTEFDQVSQCISSNKYYDITKYVGLRKDGGKLQFDERNTQRIVELFVDTDVTKIFIEPHLKQRLGVTSSKIRFHGCHSVRHDDHIHIQID